MKKILILFFCGINLASAQQSPVVTSNPVPSVTSQIDESVSYIKVAKEYYMTSPDTAAGRSFKERTQRLSVEIKSIFEKFSDKRAEVYKIATFSFHDSDWATNKTTDKTTEIEKDKYIFTKIDKSPTGGDWKGGPIINGTDRRTWTNGEIEGGNVFWSTGGHGRATTSWTISAKYSNKYIAKIVESEAQALRNKLNSLNLPVDL